MKFDHTNLDSIISSGAPLDFDYIYDPFRPKGPFTTWTDFDINHNQCKIYLRFGREEHHFMSVAANRDDLLIAEENREILSWMFRQIWTTDYKVPERESHIILGEN